MAGSVRDQRKANIEAAAYAASMESAAVMRAFDNLSDFLSDVGDAIASVGLTQAIDALPPGVDEGVAKLVHHNQMCAIVVMIESGADPNENPLKGMVEQAAELQELIDKYEARDAQPNEGALDFVGDKLEDVAEFFVENIVATLAGMAGGPLVGALAQAPKEFGSAIIKEMIDSGYDVSDPEQIKAALQNEEFMAQAEQHALVKTGVGLAFAAVMKIPAIEKRAKVMTDYVDDLASKGLSKINIRIPSVDDVVGKLSNRPVISQFLQTDPKPDKISVQMAQAIRAEVEKHIKSNKISSKLMGFTKKTMTELSEAAADGKLEDYILDNADDLLEYGIKNADDALKFIDGAKLLEAGVKNIDDAIDFITAKIISDGELIADVSQSNVNNYDPKLDVMNEPSNDVDHDVAPPPVEVNNNINMAIA